MFITVVICTRNRAEDVRRAIESILCPGNLSEPDWELLVVETSLDETTNICRDFQERFPRNFRFISEKRLGKSNALNTSILEAKGDILALTDDDVLADGNYIRAIRTVFQSYPGADAAQGRVFLDCEGGFPPWLDYGDLPLMADRCDWGDEVTDFSGTLCGTNMVVRAHIFRKSGGYSPELGPGGLGMWEDTEVSLRMREAGARMIYAPQIVLRHQWPKSRLTRAFLRKRFFGKGRAEAFYTPLPSSFFRFGLYVVKETLLKELSAGWNLLRGQPGRALHDQCDARSQAGFLWQHWQFERGFPRTLTGNVALEERAKSAIETRVNRSLGAEDRPLAGVPRGLDVY